MKKEFQLSPSETAAIEVLNERGNGLNISDWVHATSEKLGVDPADRETEVRNTIWGLIRIHAVVMDSKRNISR